MDITKAVIAVAGLGTRLLPTTKAIPKEMLPVGRLPIIQHVVEELASAGLQQQLFISSRHKAAIENHLDDYSSLMMHLELNASEMQQVSRFDYRERGIEFFFTRQQVPTGQTKPLGTGDAVASAEHFIAGEDFAVAFGDSIIRQGSGPSLLARMIASHRTHRSACTIAVYQVPPELVHLYGIVVPEAADAQAADCRLADIIEKPAAGTLTSYLAVSARYLFSPEIFSFLRTVPPAPNGEIYLTDAILALIRAGHMVRAVRLAPDEKRHDIGNHKAYFQTFIDYALEDPEWGEATADYLAVALEAHKTKKPS